MSRITEQYPKTNDATGSYSPGRWNENIAKLLLTLSVEPVASRLGSSTPVPQADTWHTFTLCQHPLLNKPLNTAGCFFVIYGC